MHLVTCVTQVMPLEQTPQNGAVLGCRCFFPTKREMPKWRRLTGDWTGQSKKRSLALTRTPRRRTRGLSPNARPSHDALPAPDPLGL